MLWGCGVEKMPFMYMHMIHVAETVGKWAHTKPLLVHVYVVVGKVTRAVHTMRNED